MTRQQEEDDDDQERAAASGSAQTRSSPPPPPPLLLRVRTVADAPLAAPAAASAASVTAFDAQRAAFVLPPTANSVAQLGVLSPALTWSPLPAGDADPTDAAAWPLAWSPDGAYVVCGGGGASLWLCTSRAWLAAADGDHGAQLLLARAELRKWLGAKELAGGARVVAACFASSSRLVLVLDAGVLVQVDVHVAKLALLALNAAADAAAAVVVATESETKPLLSMQAVKRLGEWHAGVVAAAFDAASATLVITGGLTDPSDELVRGRASSFSVWRLLAAAPFCELLDYTMVLNDGGGAEAPAGVESRAATEASGLLGAVARSVLSPLHFLIRGGADARVLHGSVRHLAVSPDGAYVAMLDAGGRVAVRQIEACSDVVGWQLVSTARIASVVWLSATVLAFVLEDGRTLFGALTKGSSSSSPSASTHAIAMLPVESFVEGAVQEAAEDVARVEVMSAVAGARLGVQLVTMGNRAVVQFVETVELSAFVDLLTASHQFDRALAVVDAHRRPAAIDLDALHRQIWTQFRSAHERDEHVVMMATDSASGFAKALDHLSLVRDKRWVASECLNVVASDSFGSMKDILETGLLALDGVASDDADADATRQQLERFAYRLETLKLVLAEDLVEDQVAESEDPLRVAEQCYDGAVFAQFRRAPLVETASQLAREGRVGSLAVLFQRNPRTLLPRRLAVLSQLPASLPPFAYAHLLPAISPDARDADADAADTQPQRFFTLQPQAAFQEFDDPLNTSLGSVSLESRVVAADVDADDAAVDLDAADRDAWERSARQSGHERREAYAAWFQTRILDMDARFGQLASAYQLSSLARECLRGDWRDCDAKRAFDSFQHAVERLYNCVYPLQLAACSLLPLDEWAALSLHDQLLRVTGDWDAATDAIDRIQAVFVAHRGGALFTLDAALATLCETLSRTCSLSALEVCAQLVHHSNPSMPVVERWIQGDAQLLRTALGVVYAATTQRLFPRAEDLATHHRAFVEQLWTIFQSLPVRKAAEELPEIEQLQVAVDEMEDLLVAMDVLSKYEVFTSPSELRDQVGEAATSTAASDLLQRMCAFSFPGTSVGGDEDAEQQRWMELWHDAMKLKTHVFGECVSQDAILDGILRHLLTYDAYLDAAEHLATNWIGSNAEAASHVAAVLLRTVQSKTDALKGNFVSSSDVKTHAAALQCVAIAKRVLPAEFEPERRAHVERQLRHEVELVHACQLLDLLSYGAVKRSPGDVRPLKDASQRLDVLLDVFASNPSNYAPSTRARDWFAAHQLAHVLQGEPGAAASPLAAVMFLAKLLRVENQKRQIVMKGAYAALYCADFDVAYALTAQVVESSSGSGDVELQHVLSLVLDLVSASSFQSWAKKLALCRATFSALDASVFGHPITHLILSRMDKLEAVEALAAELGLSEADVEDRRRRETDAKTGVEQLLLKELEVVVDLLQEEQSDRGFLLRLLQRGLALSCSVLNGARVQQTEDADGLALGLPESPEDAARVERVVQQMTRVCFAEAVTSTADDDAQALSSLTTPIASGWRTYAELGCSYLLLWSDVAGDDCDLEAFWESDVRPLLSAAAPSAALEQLVRQVHHFFLLQVAAGVEAAESAGSSGPALVLQLLNARKRLEGHARSYEDVKRFVAAKTAEPEEAPESDPFDGDDDDSEREPTTTVTQQPRVVVFGRLAKRCSDALASQQKTQALEEMSAFFNADLDLERFSRDAAYRENRILALASRSEHYDTATQFAAKYGVDAFQCLLAYIRSALLSEASASALRRHEQLELAFRREREDLLEQALQQPLAFGRFLLGDAAGGGGGEAGVYEALAGTDHVGLLFVLRMVLECSKRAAQLPADERRAAALFPLSKASSDRVTLLFMCLKRLREVEPLPHVHRGSGVADFKLVCAAETSGALLHAPAPTDASASRRAAVTAVRPFLTGKSVKLFTKLLAKLHRVSTSAVVMIYLSELLDGVWREHRERGTVADAALAADLAVYAYESCTPFFSVLTNEHLLLFLGRFFGEGGEVETTEDEFYGQRMDGLAHFGGLLTPHKRVDVVSETLGVFQSRFEAWAAAGGDADASVLEAKQRELRCLERELALAASWFVADEVTRHALVFPFAAANWRLWEPRMRRWFTASTSTSEAELLELLVLLCGSVASVEIATLLVALVLAASPLTESAPAALTRAYARAFASLAESRLGGDAERRIVGEWTSSFPDAHSALSELFADVASFVATVSGGRSATDSGRALHGRVVALLAHVSSAAVRAIATAASDSQAVQAAVVGEWRRLATQWGEERRFASSAVLARVVLDCGAAVGDAAERRSFEREFFGLQAKAAVAHLSTNSVGRDRLDTVFGLPTAHVFESFDTVFAAAIALVGDAAYDAELRVALTVALANLVWRHALLASPTRELHTWEREQRAAVAARVHHQFGVGEPPRDAMRESDDGDKNEDEDPSSAWWAVLLQRGCWRDDRGLVTWYLTLAYGRIRSPRVLEAFAAAHWGERRRVCVTLLLASPFPELHAAHRERLLAFASTSTSSSSSPSADARRVLELLLLRFDLQALLQPAGLFAELTARVFVDGDRQPPLWTSSGAYAVCALVALGELARAGRLASALWHAHPLLWDAASARLTLANFVASLAAEGDESDREEQLRLRDVYAAVSRAVQRRAW